MRVLIVNAHVSQRSVGQTLFKEFEAAVRLSLKKLAAPAATVIVCNVNELSPYLYLSPEEWRELRIREDLTDKKALVAFDHLDFVFMDGDAATPPWATSVRKAFLLLKMCYNTGKCVFGTAFAMQMLAYVCATGGRFLSVAGGLRRGAPSGIAGAHHNIDEHSVHIDIDTGNAYVRGETNEKGDITWIPAVSVGLRRHTDKQFAHIYMPPKAVEDKVTLGVSVDPMMFFTTCYKNIHFNNHWLYEGIPQNDFSVPYKHSWDLAMDNPQERSVFVIGSTRWSPAIIEFGHCVGVKFHVCIRHEVTMTILTNYVRHKYSLMQHVGQVEFISQTRYQKTVEEGGSLLFAIRPAVVRPTDLPGLAGQTSRSVSAPRERPRSRGLVGLPMEVADSTTALAQDAGSGLHPLPPALKKALGSFRVAGRGRHDTALDPHEPFSMFGERANPAVRTFVEDLNEQRKRGGPGRRSVDHGDSGSIAESGPDRPMSRLEAASSVWSNPLGLDAVSSVRLWKLNEERKLLDGGGEQAKLFESICRDSNTNKIDVFSMPATRPTTALPMKTAFKPGTRIGRARSAHIRDVLRPAPEEPPPEPVMSESLPKEAIRHILHPDVYEPPQDSSKKVLRVKPKVARPFTAYKKFQELHAREMLDIEFFAGRRWPENLMPSSMYV